MTKRELQVWLVVAAVAVPLFQLTGSPISGLDIFQNLAIVYLFWRLNKQAKP